MLRLVCVGAALAACSAFNKPKVPKFSNVFSVTIEETEIVRGNKFVIHNWCEYTDLLGSGRSRIDYNDNNLREVVIQHSHMNVTKIMVYPASTENDPHHKACQISHDRYHIGLTCMLPFYNTYMKFIGKEHFHGIEAEHWQDRFGLYNYQYIIDVWSTYRKNADGEDIPVPLRLRSQIMDEKYGSHRDDSLLDYFDYKVYDKLDPDIFNITKGIDIKTCKVTGEGEENFKTNEDILPPFFGHQSEFDLYQRTQNKQYASREEYDMRMEIYKNNVEMVERHNRANHSYTLAVNQFSDRTPEELQMMAGTRPYERSSAAMEFPYTEEEIEKLSQDLPKEFDWRVTMGGVVNIVEDDQECWAGWAFAAVGAVEGVNARVNGVHKLLSPQALVDCVYNNSGCHGGSDAAALEYIMNYGVPKYSDYGHVAGVAGFCHASDVKEVVRISSFHKIPANNTNALKLAIVKHGPVTINMRIVAEMWPYNHGVYRNENCRTKYNFSLDYSFLVVGYGRLADQEYWILKGPWTNSWGNNGYILVDMATNTCGVAREPYYVQIDKLTNSTSEL